jgi:hypothetical protein
VGGTTGQALKKKTNTDYDTEWVTLAPGGVTSIKKTGSTALTGDITLTGGTSIQLTQAGNDISIATDAATTAYVDTKSTQALVRNEVPSGTINGSNVTFTLATTPTSGSLRLYKNGVRLKITDDYTLTGLTITMVAAPATGASLLADYEVSSGQFSSGYSNLISNTVPSGAVNGTNTSFTTSTSYITNTLEVFINGIQQLRSTHYTETTPASGVFTMSDAPLTGDVITVTYQHILSSSGDANTVGGYSVLAIFNMIYPVGSIYTATVSTNPGTLLGFGTWSAYAAGRVLVGVGTSDQAFAAAATGGESNHTLTSLEMPVHAHTLTDPTHSHTYYNGRGGVGYTGGANNAIDSSLGTSGTSVAASATGITMANAGSGNAHNNLQPYIVVYMWTRTA